MKSFLRTADDMKSNAPSHRTSKCVVGTVMASDYEQAVKLRRVTQLATLCTSAGRRLRSRSCCPACRDFRAGNFAFNVS